jgi:hypothetical protein
VPHVLGLQNWFLAFYSVNGKSIERAIVDALDLFKKQLVCKGGLLNMQFVTKFHQFSFFSFPLSCNAYLVTETVQVFSLEH